MSETTKIKPPAIVSDLELTTKDTGYTMTSDSVIGSLLRTLVASKPAGVFLELGTGTGMGTAWLLDGMDAQSHLITLDSNENVSTIAKRYLSKDARVTILLAEAESFIQTFHDEGKRFDLIFADTAPGKFVLLEETLSLLKTGGFYVIHDLHFKPSWPQGHAEQVDALIANFEQRTDVQITRLNISTGVMIAVKLA
ncbi:O-methyltransferase [Tengunoibacter tsumagoiensis]|uniref:O-methyltransferase n=1 Tax=Tengunoibacter tsumagoiensis TaxID=2014871 RepID=A0A401ZTW5_9CHLR|nr:class I SAM-dependent methyltransferase [Tengunoibacter tsumagoiensis]GCE10311.1 hypothetical protein KTT_01700 [Tengunoibacter tsumagoiensis]